jgi:excisionase family DNA binding protein
MDNRGSSAPKTASARTASLAYLTVQEVAAIARCEHKAVRRAIANGQLTAFRPAKRLLIREDDAQGWIEGRRAFKPNAGPKPRGGRTGQRGPASVAKLRDLERQIAKPRLF